MKLSGRPGLKYDVLSIDIGITPAVNEVPGATEHAVPVKPIAGFNDRWLALQERIRETRGKAPLRVRCPLPFFFVSLCSALCLLASICGPPVSTGQPHSGHSSLREPAEWSTALVNPQRLRTIKAGRWQSSDRPV